MPPQRNPDYQRKPNGSNTVRKNRRDDKGVGVQKQKTTVRKREYDVGDDRSAVAETCNVRAKLLSKKANTVQLNVSTK